VSQLALFWLLLPIAAASGWYWARRDEKKTSTIRVNRLSADYFRGLNYLLNEEQDKALEVFLAIEDSDSDTVETQLALGNLFRRRGETERAIRIHQALIQRAGISEGQRAQALYELGQDYMKAGLLDRAEVQFTDLLKQGFLVDAAARELLKMYEQEREWDRAIETLERMSQAQSPAVLKLKAQFHCELATLAVNRGQADAALASVAHALRADPRCVRASILAGQIYEGQGDFERAREAYRAVLEQDLDYVPEVLAPLKRCFVALGDVAGFDALLDPLIGRYRGVSPILARTRLIEDRESGESAQHYLISQLRERPSVKGLSTLIGLSLNGASDETRDNLTLLKSLTQELSRNQSVYRCVRCGFGSKSLHWQCPSCKSWTTCKPVRGVAGE
jgi:lipopolysaccharide assembly protein B